MSARLEKRLSPEDTALVIDSLGGVSAVARLFEISQPSVSCWKTRGMPGHRFDYLCLRFRSNPVIKAIKSKR